MTRTKLRILKTTFLLAPLLVLGLLLKVYGAPVRLFFRDIVTRMIFETEEHDPFRIVWNVRTDYNEWAKSRLSKFMDLWKTRYGFEGVPDGRMITVYLVEKQVDLNRFGEIANRPDRYPMGGWIRPETLEIAVQVVGEEPYDTRKLCHMMTHLLLHIRSPDAEWSPWLEEGLAFRFNLAKDKKRQWLLQEHLNLALLARQRGEFMAMRELIESDPEELTPERRRLYYHEAHLLTSYLLEEQNERFMKYLQVEHRPGRATWEDFERHFRPIPVRNKEWTKYLNRKRDRQ